MYISIEKILSEKKYGGMGLISEKRKLCMQKLTKEWKQPPVVFLHQATFHNIFILCFWLRIERRPNQGV